MDLEIMLVSLYVFVDDWWERAHPPSPRKPGRLSSETPVSSRCFPCRPLEAYFSGTIA